MNSIYYAQLNGDDVCTSVTQYQQPLDNPPSNYKEVDSFDESIVGKKWNGSIWEEIAAPPETAESARQWRDGELLNTDYIVPLSDHPQRAAYLAYRTQLRDWPSTGDFPATKPELGS